MLPRCRNTVHVHILVALFLQRIPGWPFEVGACIVLFPLRRARTSPVVAVRVIEAVTCT